MNGFSYAKGNAFPANVEAPDDLQALMGESDIASLAPDGVPYSEVWNEDGYRYIWRPTGCETITGHSQMCREWFIERELTMTIQSRKLAIEQCKVTPLDYGEWTHYETKGGNGTYHTYVPKKPVRDTIQTATGGVLDYYEYRPTCHATTDPKKFPVCKGNSNGTVCKHCLAAINDRFRRAGKQVSWPEDGEFSRAVKLLNFGGQLIKIRNQNGSSIWGVVR